MDPFKFTAKSLAGTAKTNGPELNKQACSYALGYWQSTATSPGDSFFDVRSAIASADQSFADLIQKKSA